VRGLIAEKRVTITAPAAAVWDALTKPELVKQYLHGANLATDWKVGRCRGRMRVSPR